MAQRLVRARRKIEEAGIPYRVPPAEHLAERLDGVLAVLYLVFNEGYSGGAGNELAITGDLAGPGGCRPHARRVRGARTARTHDAAEFAAGCPLRARRRAADPRGTGSIVLAPRRDRGRTRAAAISARPRACTSCRRRLRPVTRGQPRPMQQTGPRSSRCMTSCSPRHRRPSSNSTARSPLACATTRPPGLAHPGWPGARRLPLAARRAGRPAATRGSKRGCRRPVSRGDRADNIRCRAGGTGETARRARVVMRDTVFSWRMDATRRLTVRTS